MIAACGHPVRGHPHRSGVCFLTGAKLAVGGKVGRTRSVRSNSILVSCASDQGASTIAVAGGENVDALELDCSLHWMMIGLEMECIQGHGSHST